MKKEGEKDIVGDSENDVRDNFRLEQLHSQVPCGAAPVQALVSPPGAELLLSASTPVQALVPPPGAAPVHALVPDGAVWVKANEVIYEGKVFKGPTKNVPEKQHGSTSHANDTDASGISSTENGLSHREAEMEEVEVQTKIGEDYSPDRVVRSEIREMDSNTDASVGSLERMQQRVSWIVKIESNMDSNVHEVEQRPKIQKVPKTFREIHSNKCFDPMVIAIGPVHHGKPELQQMETFKGQFAFKYAAQCGKSMEDLYNVVEKQAIDARNYYAKGSTEAIGNKEFAKMMFLDGCFVLQFIYYCLYYPVDVNMKATDIMIVFRDITLLENQLPFEFLKALLELMRFERGGEQMIDEFICELIVTEDDPHEENARCWKSCWNRKSDPKPKGDETKKGEPVHLLELVRTKFVNVKEITSGASWSPFSSGRSYRSVTELKSAGINFKCSSSRRFSDITFKSGCLRLPRITIDDYTESLLLNLVAWEACLDNPDDFAVSSYVHLMDTLIDDAEDVKKLKYSGVMVNELGSDKPVADLFNKITRNLVWNPRAFGTVKESISNYCNKRYRFWWAEWVDAHFRSPWATIALIAAILALGLTLAQTVFSAIQL